MYWNLVGVKHCSAVGGTSCLPCESEVIRQIARMHLLDAFTNIMPVPRGVEVLIIRVQLQQSLVSASELEQRDLLSLDLSNVIVIVSMAKQCQDSSLGIDSFGVAVALEVAEEGLTVLLSSSEIRSGGRHPEGKG